MRLGTDNGMQDIVRISFIVFVISVAAGIPSKSSSTCYQYVGCFDVLPPFTNTDGILPQSPKEIGTKLLLYTRENPIAEDVLDYMDIKTVSKSNFNSKNPVKIIIHGFAMSIDSSPWYTPLKEAILETEPANVVFVGWKNGARMPYYRKAIANTRVVAKEISLLVKLMTQLGSKLQQIHLIGHSLGAQIAGYVGREFDGEIGRISGLDPAGPKFQNQSPDVRLDSTDAIFVDVIHSNGAPLYRGGAGTSSQSGHVDFFPNGGAVQPGCEDFVPGSFKDLLKGKPADAFDVVSCSHSRSHDVFVESVKSKCPFTAYPCVSFDDFVNGRCFTCGNEGCNHMGYHANNVSSTGSMMLMSKGKFPYCGYHYMVTVKANEFKEEMKLDFDIAFHGFEEVSDPVSVNSLALSNGVSSRVVVSRSNIRYIAAIDFTVTNHHRFLQWAEEYTRHLPSLVIEVTIGQSGRTFTFCLPGGETMPRHAEVSINGLC